MKSKRAAGTRASTTKPSPSDLKALMRAIELGLESKVNAALAKCSSVDVVVPTRFGGTITPLRAAVRTSNHAIVAALLTARRGGEGLEGPLLVEVDQADAASVGALERDQRAQQPAREVVLLE